MKEPNAASAPQRIARVTAVLFLLTILLGIFAQFFVSNRLIVWRDAAATAANITRERDLHQWGFTLYMLEMAAQVAMTALFYVLLRPVSRSVALVATCLGLVGAVIKTLGRLFYLSPMFVLDDARGLSAFTPEQLPALALLLLRLNDHAAAMALGFFGLSGVLRGWLMYRSRFLPRWLGAVSVISGVGWMAFLSPTLGYRVFPIVALLALVGSVATIVWLLIFGVDEKRWREQAMAGGAGS